MRGRWRRFRSTPEQTKRNHDRQITCAVFAGGRLWLSPDGGTLSSLISGSRQQRDEVTPGAAADLCALEGAPVILASRQGGLQLRRRHGESWQQLASVRVDDREGIRAISCSSARTLILTDAQVLVIEGDGQRTVRLLDRIRISSVNHDAAGCRSVLYVGLDPGELGGGPLRIDRDRCGDEARESPGQSMCRAAQPGVRPGQRCRTLARLIRCVVAAIGLVHFFRHGRLVEVCGDRVRRFFTSRTRSDELAAR
jgi:hypothetical protein